MRKIEREYRQYREKQRAVTRIIACYEGASSLEIRQGKNWYPEAYTIAESLTPNDPSIGAGVIAALSPRVSWSENVQGARELVKAYEWGMSICPVVAGLGRNRAKAWSILHHEYFSSPVECLNQSDRSYKVNRFFANIMGDIHVCTLDVWAARVAIDNAPDAVNGKRYLSIEAAYQSAAIQIGYVSPRDLQAICWTRVRVGSKHAGNDYKVTE